MEEVTPRSNEHWKRQQLVHVVISEIGQVLCETFHLRYAADLLVIDYNVPFVAPGIADEKPFKSTVQAYLGPLPDEFLRVTTAQDIQEVSDRQAALALQSHHNSYTPYMAPNFVGRLSITIAQAKLVKNYGITRMDPYVRLRVGHFVYETQTAPNGGRNPRWNRVIHCQLPAGVDTIALEIYDECNFSMDELIAWAEIRIPQSVLRGETHEDWYPLSGKQGDGLEGSIDMVMSFNNMVVQPRMIHTNAPVVLVPNVATGTPMPVFVAPNQPQVARPPPPVLTDDDLTRIHEMFPQIDKEVIKSVAVANNQDRDAVINALLQMSS